MEIKSWCQWSKFWYEQTDLSNRISNISFNPLNLLMFVLADLLMSLPDRWCHWGNNFWNKLF